MASIGFDAVRVIIWCPHCFEQHIDEQDSKPHNIHHCEFCKTEWKFTEWDTLGVRSLPMTNSFTRNAKPVSFASLRDFNEAVEYATKHLKITEQQNDEMIRRAVAAASIKSKRKWPADLWFPLFILAIGLAYLLISLGDTLPKLLLK